MCLREFKTFAKAFLNYYVNVHVDLTSEDAVLHLVQRVRVLPNAIHEPAPEVGDGKHALLLGKVCQRIDSQRVVQVCVAT